MGYTLITLMICSQVDFRDGIRTENNIQHPVMLNVVKYPAKRSIFIPWILLLNRRKVLRSVRYGRMHTDALPGWRPCFQLGWSLLYLHQFYLQILSGGSSLHAEDPGGRKRPAARLKIQGAVSIETYPNRHPHPWRKQHYSGNGRDSGFISSR